MNTFPKRLYSEQIERTICEYYWTRQPSGFYPSYKETGEAFNCSPAHVRNLLQRHGYKRRTQVETREKRPCKKPYDHGEPPMCACGCSTNVTWDTKNSHWFKFAPGHYSGYSRKVVQPTFGKPMPQERRSLILVSRKQALHKTIDRERLVALYVENNHTIAEVADILSVGRKTVRRALRHNSIPIRTLSESLISRGSTRGPKNPAWKGGVAEWDYSPDWKRICKEIKDRDKWTCQHCGETRKRWGIYLHVHHIDGNKMNNHPDNLISLCATCHRKAHGAA